MTNSPTPTLDEQLSQRTNAASVAVNQPSADSRSTSPEAARESGLAAGAVLLVGITFVVLGLILVVCGLQGTSVIGSLIGVTEGVDDFAPGLLMTIFGIVTIYSRDWTNKAGRT